MDDFIEVPAGKGSLLVRTLLYGVGLNDAPYLVKGIVRGKLVTCPFYAKWASMLTRCYSEKYQEKQPTYKGCFVVKEWLTFSAFKLWMSQQEWRGNSLDKDLLIQGNKEYSPDTCLLIPQSINKLTTDRGAKRGEYPQGVNIHTRTGKYMARVMIDGSKEYLGLFVTPIEAFEAYKVAKYANIKRVAMEQAEPLRSALLRWVIN